MNEKIIKFYLTTNKLKDVVRTGWTEVNINRDRIESVAEHIYGTLILTMAIDSEKELNLDIFKVFKMINHLKKLYSKL